MVRKALFALGYRYRLHSPKLPGKPDLFFPSRKKAIFIHGCFWHRHLNCGKARMPKTRQDFWRPKFAANVARDARNQSALEEQGWHLMIIWECELRDMARVIARSVRFIES